MCSTDASPTTTISMSYAGLPSLCCGCCHAPATLSPFPVNAAVFADWPVRLRSPSYCPHHSHGCCLRRVARQATAPYHPHNLTLARLLCLQAGPLSWLRLPFHLRHLFHGCWVCRLGLIAAATYILPSPLPLLLCLQAGPLSCCYNLNHLTLHTQQLWMDWPAELLSHSHHPHRSHCCCACRLAC